MPDGEGCDDDHALAGANSEGDLAASENSVTNVCVVVQPLDLHLVNVGSIPTGPTHGEV